MPHDYLILYHGVQCLKHHTHFWHTFAIEQQQQLSQTERLTLANKTICYRHIYKRLVVFIAQHANALHHQTTLDFDDANKPASKSVFFCNNITQANVVMIFSHIFSLLTVET